MVQSERTIVCSKCGCELKPIGNGLNSFQSAGWVASGFSEADKQGFEQWLGTTCVQCHMVFCEKCRDVGPGSCPNCGGEIRPAAATWLPKNAGKTAVRVLIAHTGESLASQDLTEILKYAWDGQVSKDVKITSNPLTPAAWTGDEQFAIAWGMWQQMLQHTYGEHSYWDSHETYAYSGTIVRTGQRFYVEIYYRDTSNAILL
jgi:hypothetical protein